MRPSALNGNGLGPMGGQALRSDAGTGADEPSKIISGESDGPEPIRPQAMSIPRTSEPGSGGTSAAAAADWRCNLLSAKNCEGSATSDEDHPRLVPRRGAGPDLRSSGREIDEYLMRLLHAGSVPNQPAPTSLAFPAGWNNARPWFEAAGQQQAAARAGGSGGSAGAGQGVRPVMPPPAFPAQPWQGSRLGPLPPLGPFPPSNPHLEDATQMRGESSCGGAVSEGATGEDISAGESQQRRAALRTLPTPEQPSSVEQLRARIGEAGVAKLQATVHHQQDTLQQQVADLHRLLKRQMVLMEEAAALRLAAAAAAAAGKRQKSCAWPADAQDPQTVLVSSLGGGGSGSVPSSNANNASSVEMAAATSDEGHESRETLRVAALAHRSQQLRKGGCPGAAPAACRAAQPKRPSLDSNTSEQLELGSMRGAAPAGMCGGSHVTCQQLQEADARLRSASLELSQQGAGGSLGGGSPLAAALGGQSVVQAALRSLEQQQASQGCSPRATRFDSHSGQGAFGDSSAQQQQQQQAAFAQQSFMAAAGQAHFQDQLMFPGGPQPGNTWFAEAMRQMQQQSCMAAFDPRFFPWFYQANLSAMNASFNGLYPAGLAGGGMWPQGTSANMFATGPNGSFNMQPHAGNAAMQGGGMYDGHSMHAAEREQRDEGKSAASQGSARVSSHHKQPGSATDAAEGAGALAEDEATSSLVSRGKKRKH